MGDVIGLECREFYWTLSQLKSSLRWYERDTERYKPAIEKEQKLYKDYLRRFVAGDLIHFTETFN